MSPATPIRVGVLGTGAIAQVAHLPILSRMRGVQVVGLRDSDRAKARTLADRFAVERVYASDEQLWGDDSVDAVIVCTPSHLHEEQVRSALEAGKFVFCEKPLALTAAGAERVLATDGADARLVVGMNQRFRPDAHAVRSFVSGGELGDIFYVRTGWLNRRVGQGRRTWRHRSATAGGGALMDLGLPMLDLALWLLDFPEPRRVVAHFRADGADQVEDSALLLLETADGRLVNLEVTWLLHDERERQFLHVNGSRGSASLAPLKVLKELDSGLLDVTPPLPPGRENQFTASYRQALAFFADVVRGVRQARPPVEQLAVLRILEAAYLSGREGREVRF